MVGCSIWNIDSCGYVLTPSLIVVWPCYNRGCWTIIVIVDSTMVYYYRSDAAYVRISSDKLHPQEVCQGICFDPINPGGKVLGCFVGCTLGTSDISPFFGVAAAFNVHREFSELNKCIFKRVRYRCGGISFLSFVFSSNTNDLLRVWGQLASFTPL